MRLFLPFILWLAALLPAIGQTAAAPVEIDPRLHAAFDADYLQRLQIEQPVLLLRWNFYLDNAFTISDFPPAKGNIGDWPTVQIADLTAVNILLLEKEQHLSRDWDKPVFYRIGGTQKVLMYWPGREFNRRFQEWLSEK